MGDYVPLNPGREEAEASSKEGRRAGGTRVASLDVFRGLSIAVSSLLASLTPRFRSLVVVYFLIFATRWYVTRSMFEESNPTC
ncbi:hypothetical protein GW17_00000294 [Ensete ventricosum]|nr:hypothetical protein GW17_00000294 [Ensete ventricosum]